MSNPWDVNPDDEDLQMEVAHGVKKQRLSIELMKYHV